MARTRLSPRTVVCLWLSPIAPLLLLTLLWPPWPVTSLDATTTTVAVIQLIPPPSALSAEAFRTPTSLRSRTSSPTRSVNSETERTAAAQWPVADGTNIVMADYPDRHSNAGYVPAAHLHERPAALDEIADAHTQPTPWQPIECVLLISEQGDVDDVLFPDAVLTPAQQQAWRSRLTAIRFSPGRLYGRAVRTALRLELRMP